MSSFSASSPVSERRELSRLLERALPGKVDSSKRRRAEYSTDASNYRVVPEVVVFPSEPDDILATLEISRSTGIPVTMRGGGTSVAGNAVGPGIVLDMSRSYNKILDLDPESRTARVQPGVVQGALQKAAAPHGLRFGPDPSTWARCTIGGMIGNNACGSHSLQFGRTADNVIEMDVIDGAGKRFLAGTGLEPVSGLDDFVSKNLALFRTELGKFGRQVSGYSLEHLLPENGRSLARALVGTEGTCVSVLEATVRLVDMPIAPFLVVLGYPDMPSAADAVPTLLSHRPGAIEGLDARLVDAVRNSQGDSFVADLPRGAGWLLVEMSGTDEAETLDRAEKLAAASEAVDHRIIPPGAEARSVWRIREDGAGLAGRTQAGNQAWPGFEDAAVPPENLGAYLRDFDELTASHGIEGMPYGHFGDGCIHVRLDIPLEKDGSALRSLMEDAGRLVARHGGSLSGEHGDGRARSELLPMMYSPELIAAFGAFKNLFDPNDLMNPGVLVRPQPLDRNLRRPAALPLVRVNGYAFTHDDGDFTKAVHRCVGVGKCRADNTAAGGFMCPSYLATGDEKDSTRGRARVLQEMANGTLVTGGWKAPEVHDVLDLCLSCKACSSDCPAGVDMAAYKSEVLHRTYEGRMRPITHYLLGWLPRWARLVNPVARLANAALGIGPIQKLVLWAGGMDTRRSIPRFADRSFSRSKARPATYGTSKKQVLLWVDSFSDNFTPGIARSAITVLESAGYEVIAPPNPVCCGLTWITTGQLTGAKRILSNLIDEFHPVVARGIPIVGLEPSCTAVLRSDLRDLFADDPRAAEISEGTYTLAELLTTPAPLGPENWTPPRLDGEELVVQPHCHHHAVMGYGTDIAFLETLGAEITELSGCCGLAGNFGMEKGHYEMSVAVAENALLPALRNAPPESTLLADGFSCRTQANQLGGTDGVHLAELLARALEESATP
ncbi:FAD-linked oxidase C-terminal domain-containing protein [Microbacterium sp.]|uniref:FAD-binding and (Fe-S)-binding domain-containing protein n=1 Tax=Microbacterium sp. TaxID=51671 RepID=UPI0028A5CF67|nr:FAD-linked oxidase C-terminal domain-containing protein [Microbacterium sp.]